jgi:Saxitoxin biosynthesis operon protein SxtJ
MQWSDIQFRPPEKTLRQFAWLWLAFFGGLAAWEGIVRQRTILAAAFAVLALSIGPVGIIRPQTLRPIYVAWMVLAFPIGWTISQAILALMFYGLFTPIGLIFRIIGRDPLHRARVPGVESYWSPKTIPADPRRYFKQF